MTGAIDRVRRVLAAGARIANPADPLGVEARDRLASTSGLSRAGIELALSEHLETDASDDDLAAFVACAGRARRTAVVLSANVCTASLRAIAFACATSEDVIVKASRRDPVVADLLIRALEQDVLFVKETGAGVRAVDDLPRLGEDDEVHVYGGDAAIGAITASLAPGVVLRAHGPGFGAALIDRASDTEVAAAALAKDVIAFDQRGCLSPRIALVEGSDTRAFEFALELDRELRALSTSIPRGRLDVCLREEIARYAYTMETVGAWIPGDEHGVGVDTDPRTLTLPPAARYVHVVALGDHPDAACALLVPWSAGLTSLGVSGALETAAFARSWTCRLGPLGVMQKPPFDGPVDLRPNRKTPR